MIDKPLVSVIMPNYNGAKFIEKSINSILNQTYQNFELIIIDDGSSDNSTKLIESFDSKKIRFYINDENLGVSATRNRAIDLSNGKYIAFMDSDDISPLNRLEIQVDFLEKNDEFGLLSGHYESFTEYYGLYTKRKFRKHSIIEEKIKVDLNFFGAIVSPATMIKKSVIDKHNIKFDTNLRIAEDFDFWRRIGKYSKVMNLDKKLIYYRKHQNNSIKKRNLNERHFVKALKKSFYDLGISFENIFDENERIKNLESFFKLIDNLKSFEENNKKNNQFNQKYLNESISQLIFLLYKINLAHLGYRLYSALKLNGYFENIKIRVRDRIKLIKYFILSTFNGK